MKDYQKDFDVLQSTISIPNLANLTVLDLLDIANANGLHLMLIPEKRFDKISCMIEPGYSEEGDPPYSYGEYFDSLSDDD